MNPATEISCQPLEQMISGLHQIRHFDGHPGRFWPAFLELATGLAGGTAGLLLVQAGNEVAWKSRSVYPAEYSALTESPERLSFIEEIAHTAAAEGAAWERRRTNPGPEDDGHTIILGLRLDMEEGERVHVAVFILEDRAPEEIEWALNCLKLVADTPSLYQSERAARRLMNEVVHFSEALDLMSLINGEKRYVAAAMTFVNEVASRYQCPRVSLGWLEGGYVRLQAISHMERFEKKMAVVQGLEAAMEEALDQDEEILWPALEGSTAVARDHEAFAREQGARFMVSIPVRLDDVPVGVLTCERSEGHFSESQVAGLRILCDQGARRLGDLKEKDRWIGSRMASAVREKAAGLVGVENTFAKLAGLVGCGLLVFLLFGQLPYRVESPFILRSDNLRYLPAPFKGYIDQVHVDVGEEVEEGELLLTLDTRDLLLEESAAIANQIRYLREAEKARAENSLAEMNIGLALADQAKAKLDLVRYHLSLAEVKAPFRGIVVEGDFKELLGAPVEKGDVFFKVSRIDKMYVELEVSERDIHLLEAGAPGEMAFVSQPQMTFPIEVERIDPVAIAKKEEGNVFLVRCRFSEAPADWWRPGMSGVAKIAAGKRNVLWILTHRTVDFFRILLWW